MRKIEDICKKLLNSGTFDLSLKNFDLSLKNALNFSTILSLNFWASLPSPNLKAESSGYTPCQYALIYEDENDENYLYILCVYVCEEIYIIP